MVNEVSIEKKLLRDYWIKKLQNHESGGIGAEQPGEFGSFRLKVDSEVNHRIKGMALNDETSVFVIYLTLFSVLLYRYYNEESILISSVGSSPADSEGESLLFFRLAISGEDKLKGLLTNVASEVQESFGYAGVDSQELKDTLEKRGLKMNELYHYGFCYDGVSTKSPGFDLINLQFHVENHANKAVSINITYNTSQYEEAFVHRMASHYQHLLGDLNKSLNTPVDKINFMSDDEIRQVIEDFNDTGSAGSAGSGDRLGVIDRSLGTLFKGVSRDRGEAMALYHEGQRMSYSELDGHSDRLASHLRGHYGVGRGAIVALQLGSSFDRIIALLGVLKSGAAYVPLSPEQPLAGVAALLADSQARLLITTADRVMDLSEVYTGSIMALDVELGGLPAAEAGFADVNHPDDAAYLIYTSGSTGQPKGVVVSHQSVVRLVRQSNYYPAKVSDRVVQLSPYHFDGSVFDIYGSLLNGSSLYLIGRQAVLSSQGLVSYLVEHQINVMFITTALFNNLVSFNASVVAQFDKLYFGGEEASVRHVRQALAHRKRSGSLVHVYGPTEGTTFSSYYEVDELVEGAGQVPIGGPVSHTRLYLLDGQRQVVPVGVVGEVYLGGAGLAQGYWQDAALTKAKFVEAPGWLGVEDRLYRTGDLGYWTGQGAVVFKGRVDDQVKLRGHRLELGAVEQVLMDSGMVDQACARLLTDQAGDKQLVVYYTGCSEVSKLALREHMHSQVGVAMRPSHYVWLEALPLSGTGKVDKQRLPDWSAVSASSGAGGEAQTAMQQAMVVLWSQVLGRDSVGIGDNFFMIGGDSIKAIRLVSGIRKELGKAVEVKDLFAYPEVASLCSYVAGQPEVPVAGERYGEAVAALAQLKAEVLQGGGAAALPADWEDFFPMSDIQRGMVYYSQLHQGQPVFHDQLYYQIEEVGFDFALFKQAYAQLVAKHGMLRTSFQVQDFSEPLQVVHRAAGFAGPAIEQEDLRHLDDHQQRVYLEEYLVSDRNVLFDVRQAGLWRLRVFRLKESEYGLLFVYHHAIMDGWSNASLIAELSAVYQALKGDAHYRVSKLKASYKDYVLDQLTHRGDEGVANFWRRSLSGYRRTGLPYGRRLVGQDLSKQRYTRSLSVPLISQLKGYSGQSGVSLKELCLAGYLYLLKMTVNTDEVTVGVVSNARPGIEDGDKIVGCFLNTVPYRLQVGGGWTNHRWLSEVQALHGQVKRHDKLSLREIAQLVEPGGGPGNPIYDVLYNYVDFHITRGLGGSVEKKESLVSSYENANTLFDLTVGISGEAIVASFIYLEALYGPDEIGRLFDYYQRILSLLAREAETPLRIEDIIPEDEKQVLLNDYNQTEAAFDSKTLPAAFEQQVRRCPTQTAVCCGQHSWTYEALNASANQLARYLTSKLSVSQEEVVAIYLSSSYQLVTCVVAVLKAGATVLPIDPSYPSSRVLDILADSKAKLLIVKDSFLPSSDVDQLVLSRCQDEIRQEEETNLGVMVGYHAPAYVVYTSGSSGVPKGICLTHANLANQFQWFKQYFDFKPEDVLPQKTPLSFVDSVIELLFPITFGGGALYLRAALQTHMNFSELGQWFSEVKATILQFVPSIYAEFVKYFDSNELTHLRALILSGEELTEDFSQNPFAVYNLYGCSECAASSTICRLPRDTASPRYSIGKPISNTAVYILDDDKKLLPKGVVGEVYIGGSGVANGYLHDPEATKTRFSDSPYQEKCHLYKTGDLGRWSEDGNLYYEGRRDDQIKLRGVRINPREVEQRICQYTGIEKAVVIAREIHKNKKALTAYVESDKPVESVTLSDYLHQFIPHYMVPTSFVQVEKIPLNSSGKIDRKRLLKYGDEIRVHAKYEAPDSELEKTLQKIWSQVLRKDKIGVNDNFFAIGGDSISALQISSLVYKIGAKLAIKDIFRFPSIRRLALHMQEGGHVAKQGMITGHTPLTAAQKLLEEQGGGHAETVILYAKDKNKIQEDGVKSVFAKLLTHHDVLRASFVRKEESIYQYYQDDKDSLSFIEFDLSQKESEKELFSRNVLALQESINTDLETLIKVGLFHLSDGDRLVITIHSLIADVASWNIILDDLNTLLEQYNHEVPLSLPLKTTSYKRWGEENEKLSSSSLMADRERGYWSTLKDQINVATKVRSDSKPSSVQKVDIVIDEENTAKLLHEMTSELEVGVEDILLTAYGISLQKVFKREKTLIALEKPSREKGTTGLNISKTVGQFTTVYPFVLRVSDENSLLNATKIIKEETDRVPDNRMGGSLSDNAVEEDDAVKLSLLSNATISFRYLGCFETNWENPSFSIVDGEAGFPCSIACRNRFDIEVMGGVVRNQLRVVIYYQEDACDDALAERLSQSFEDCIANMIASFDQQDREPTPADFDYKELSVNDLETLFD